MKQIIEIEVPDGKKAVWKDGEVVFEDIYICTPKEEVKSVEHEFVDLGLPSGRLWATCNIGADKPTDYGDLFACGAVEPYDINNCKTDSFNETDAAKLSEMDDEHDAAKVLWGYEWRMPTLTDFAELIDNCTFDSRDIDGITCGMFTSKVNNQKIVMPSSRYIKSSSVNIRVGYGNYWSRSFPTEWYAWRLGFIFGIRDVDIDLRNRGYCVRPVRS